MTSSNHWRRGCGVKYFAGLFGNRVFWSSSFQKLTEEEKYQVVYGRFNLINPRWKDINAHPHLQRLVSFPNARRIYFIESNYAFNEVKHVSLRLTTSEIDIWKIRNAHSDAFRNDILRHDIVTQAYRTDTWIYAYSIPSKVLVRVSWNPKSYAERRLCWKAISGSQTESGSTTDAANALLSLSPLDVQEHNSINALKFVCMCLSSHFDTKHSEIPHCLGSSLRVILDNHSAITFSQLFRWFVFHNDPRTPSSVTAEIHAHDTSQIHKPFYTVLYCPVHQPGVACNRYLKKNWGFYKASETEKGSQVEDNTVSIRIQSTLDKFHSAALA